MFLAFLIFMAVFFYLAMAGVVNVKASKSHVNSCPKPACSEKNVCDDGKFGSFFIGAFWPVAIPVALGNRVGKADITGDTREERKMRRDVERAKHLVTMAELRAQEALALEAAASTNPLTIQTFLDSTRELEPSAIIEPERDERGYEWERF